MNQVAVQKAISEVALARNVETDDVYDAMEDAILTCARKKFKEVEEIEVKLDRLTLDISAWEIDPESGERKRELPEFDFTRVGATIAKQILTRDISRSAKREIIEKYKDAEGRLVLGIVKNTIRQGVILSIGEDEAIITREHACRGEKLREGEKVWGIIAGIRDSREAPYVIVSRADAMLVVALMAEYIPEIGRSDIEVMGIARMPGIKTKILVRSAVPGINPVATIIGTRGSTINQITNELGSERVDVIEYVDDQDYLVRELFKPAEVINISETDGGYLVEIEGGDKEMSMALGRCGSNAILAGDLLETHFKVCTSEKAKEIRKATGGRFVEDMAQFGLNEIGAWNMYESGFRSVFDILLSDPANLEEFGIDEEKQNSILESLMETPGTRLDTMNIDYNTLIVLLEYGFRSCEEIADKDIEELDLDTDEEGKSNLIMAAREACGMI